MAYLSFPFMQPFMSPLIVRNQRQRVNANTVLRTASILAPRPGVYSIATTVPKNHKMVISEDNNEKWSKLHLCAAGEQFNHVSTNPPSESESCASSERSEAASELSVFSDWSTIVS